jgi:hypothetical protein
MVLPVTSLDQLFGAALLVPGAVDTARATAARERHAASFTRYALVDRGSYELVANPDEAELVALMRSAAERATGRALGLAESRIVRLRSGDYVLAHHDRIHDDNPVEVMLDLSPARVPDAELHYRRSGQVFFRVPCTPGMLSIVERGVTVTSNHCYVSKLLGDVTIVRFIVLMRDSAPAMHTTRSSSP